MQPTEEQWLPIAGYEGLYEVSDQGRVRSLRRVIYHSHTGRQTIPGRILKPWLSAFGYEIVSLWRADEGWKQGVHILVVTAFYGPRGADMVVRHLDGNPTNNQVTNLRWGTQSENIQDCVRQGNHHYAKRSHCKNGHEFTPENTKPRPEGGRWCLTCQRVNANRAAARKRAARAA